MTKEQLKDGDRLILRNGEIGYFIGNHGIVIQGGPTYNFDHYSDDLIDRWNGDIYDIVKVERIQPLLDMKQVQFTRNNGSVMQIFIKEDWNYDYKKAFTFDYQTIWEREESKPYEVDNFPSIKEQERMVEFIKSFKEEKALYMNLIDKIMHTVINSEFDENEYKEQLIKKIRNIKIQFDDAKFSRINRSNK